MRNKHGNRYRLRRIAKAYASQGYKTYAQLTVIENRAVVHLLHAYRYGTQEELSFESTIVHFGTASTAIKAITEAVHACPDTFNVWYTITDFTEPQALDTPDILNVTCRTRGKASADLKAPETA